MSISKLLGVKKARVQPFDEVQSQVENALLDRQAEQTFSEDSDKLQNLTYANPESLEVAARALNLDMQSTPLFDKNGTKSGISSNPKIVGAGFSRDVLFQGNNSDLIQVDPNTVVVLRVKEHKPSAILPLADVESSIQLQLRKNIARKEAQSQGEMILSQLKDHKISLVEVSKKYSLSLQQEINAGRYDTKVDAAILNQAFKMPYPSSKGMMLPSGDYAIIFLDAVHQGEFDKNKADIQSRIFREELESNYGHLDYQFYVSNLMKKAKIKFNQDSSAQDNMNSDSDSSSP
jgi:peptidyl-prolyl cis-trans isomerase D